MEIAIRPRRLSNARAVPSRMPAKATAMPDWDALSQQSGESIESLKVFAAAYQNTATSGLAVHAIFAGLASNAK